MSTHRLSDGLILELLGELQASVFWRDRALHGVTLPTRLQAEHLLISAHHRALTFGTFTAKSEDLFFTDTFKDTQCSTKQSKSYLDQLVNPKTNTQLEWKDTALRGFTCIS